MPPLYVVEQGARLSVEKQRLVVSREGDTITRVPFAHTSTVVIFGMTHITTPAMKRLMRAGIDVIFLTQSGSYEGRLVGPMSKFGLLRRQQHRLLADSNVCLALAQQIVRGKCKNMRTLLMRWSRDHPDPVLDASVVRIGEMIARTGRTTRLNSLRGVEGAATAAYFQGMRTRIQSNLNFAVRRRRPPTDPVNVLLSFGYTLLTRALEATVNLVGLDPYIGILHGVEYGRPSLALDLMEEFRAIIVDSVTLRCLNTGAVSVADFTESTGAYPLVMADAAKRRFIQAYEQRLATSIMHPVTGEQITYRRAMEVQTRLLARCLRDETIDYQPFEVR